MTSFHKLKRSLSEALTQFLWDQWVSIGVAGATRSRPLPFVVDPEVLLLATTKFGLGDARLFGEALDWLALNGKLLGAQRLKSLHLGSRLGDARVLQAMDRHLAEVVPGSPSKLLAFATTALPSPRLAEWFGESAFELRGLSRRPDPSEPEAFLFKMRSFFGINARAEVFSWLLLSGRSGHPAGIARQTGWGAKTIQVVLNEMAESGLVSVTEGEREKQFRIHQDDWKFLLPKGHRPVWWSQAPFYEACSGIVQLLDELDGAASSSEAAKAVKIRGLLPGVTKNFVLAKQSGRFETPVSLRGAELVEAVNSETLRLINDIKDRESLMTPGENLLR
jgi:hypothetical protein